MCLTFVCVKSRIVNAEAKGEKIGRQDLTKDDIPPIFIGIIFLTLAASLTCQGLRAFVI